jgi:hypothetical protein
MSRPFNDTENLTGLVQMYEEELGLDAGVVSGNTTKLKRFASNMRSAFDTYTSIAIRSAGNQQYDDTNHDDMPFIEADLVSGQRIYQFLQDETNNFILDIFKVMIKTPAGIYVQISPVDQQTDPATTNFWDESGPTGTATKYDKTGNTISLDLIPNYSWRQANEGERGLKLFINREASYLPYTATTEKPGVPGIHHDYFYLKPAYNEARRKSLAALPRLEGEMLKWEGNEEQGIRGKIATYFSERPRDEKRRLSVAQQNNR